MGFLKNKDITVDRLMFYGFSGMLFFIPVATSPAVIIGLLTLGIWVFSGRFIRDYKKWLATAWIFPVAAFVLLHWLGLLWTEDVSTGLIFAKKSYYWLFAFAISGMAFSASRMDVFMKAYIAGVSFTSLLFLTQLIGLIPMRPPYSIGLLNRWAHISFSLLVTFGILLLSFYFKKSVMKKQRILFACLMFLNFLALSMMLSDSGHLAFILLSPVITYNLLGKRHLLKILGVSILLVTILFLSPVTSGRLDEAISDTAGYSESKWITPVGTRYYMWEGALKIYIENPIFGVGTGGYQSAMEDLRINKHLPDKTLAEDPIQPHNSLLYMVVSFGILGIITLVWLFILLIKQGWQKRQSLSGFSVLAFTIVLIIGSLTDTQIMQIHTALLFSMFTGLTGALHAEG